MALPHSLPGTVGADLLLACGLPTLTGGAVYGCQAQEGKACHLPPSSPAPPLELTEQAWELKS